MPIAPDRLRSRDVTYDSALARLEYDTIRRVNREMRGQDADRVYAVLMSRLAGRFPGAELNQLHLRRVAAAIAKGTLSDQ
jgi:hypothetical protein